MNIRLKSMLFLSKLKRDNLSNYLHDIENHFKNISLQNNETKINKLLEHANSTVPYYSRVKTKKFNDLPIVSKSIIMENYEDFISSEYNIDDSHIMETSGSTGKKFRIHQNKDKRTRVIADLVYFYNIAHYEMGNSMLYAGTFPEKQSKLKKIKTNITNVDMSSINNEVLNKTIFEINSDKYETVLSYTTFLNAILNYVIKENKKINKNTNLKSIITSASYMPLQTKKELENCFGVPIIDRYSNQECGVLAQTLGTEDSFKVNTASFYIEILKVNSNEPASIGEIGRVVVTDLYNYQIPLLRYDTGDLAIAEAYSEKLGITKIKEIHGRLVQVIELKNSSITTHTLNDFFLLNNFKFSTYQCIVDQNNLEFRLPLKEKDRYNKELIKKELEKLVNNEFIISIVFSDQFIMSNSNKFETIIIRREK